jgi:hypothetical protein
MQHTHAASPVACGPGLRCHFFLLFAAAALSTLLQKSVVKKRRKKRRKYLRNENVVKNKKTS